MTTTAAINIKSGDMIIHNGLTREVLSARTFGNCTDITLCGIQSRYSTSQIRKAHDAKVEVVQ